MAVCSSSSNAAASPPDGSPAPAQIVISLDFINKVDKLFKKDRKSVIHKFLKHVHRKSNQQP